MGRYVALAHFLPKCANRVGPSMQFSPHRGLFILRWNRKQQLHLVPRPGPLKAALAL